MGYNIFADMGFENPEEELMKSEIISSLRALIDEKHLTQEQVAARWRMEPSTVAELLHGHWGTIRLINFSVSPTPWAAPFASSLTATTSPPMKKPRCLC